MDGVDRAAGARREHAQRLLGDLGTTPSTSIAVIRLSRPNRVANHGMPALKYDWPSSRERSMRRSAIERCTTRLKS